MITMFYFIFLIIPVISFATWWYFCRKLSLEQENQLISKFFKGKTILITGASMGIGAETAIRLSKYETKLIICSRKKGLLEDVASLCRCNGAEVCSIVCDVSSLEDCQSVVNSGLSKFNCIDILLLNAGISATQKFEEMPDLKLIETMMNVNFYGYVNMTYASLPSIIKSKGTIAAVCSISSIVGVPYRTAYCSSKFAVQGFMTSLRLELQKKGVKVCILNPPWVDSGLQSRHIVETQKKYSGSKMTVQECVHVMLVALATGKREENFTLKNKLARLGLAIAPQLVDAVTLRHVEE